MENLNSVVKRDSCGTKVGLGEEFMESGRGQFRNVMSICEDKSTESSG
jgi:hypothetical protein